MWALSYLQPGLFIKDIFIGVGRKQFIGKTAVIDPFVQWIIALLNS